jgi:hypothetical protein
MVFAEETKKPIEHYTYYRVIRSTTAIRSLNP